MRKGPFQGPSPPWCIGSVVGSPQLKTTREPFLFDVAGAPDELLHTGCKLQHFSEPFVHPVEQWDYAFGDLAVPYAPATVVNNLLLDDVHAKLALVHESNEVFGNRLSCVQCSDGNQQVIFPVGENVNCLGGVVCYKDDEWDRWSPFEKEEGEPDIDWLHGARLSVSPSLGQPIRQLSTLRAHDSDESFVLSRTGYQVHLTKVEKQNDRVSFGSGCVTSFTSGVAHVTWSPHIHGELAAVLETGEVLLYDMHSDNLREILKFKVEREEEEDPPAKPASKARFSKAIQRQLERLSSSWWRCEYAWHPRILLVAHAGEISMFDRRNENVKPIQMATPQHAKIFCSSLARDNRFVALARSDYNPYHFAAATEQHLQLFDVRRPKAALLQWEHTMQDDFPGYLSMLPLSTLCAGEKTAGNAIIAASFRSGDLRLFCYDREELPPSSRSTRFREIEESYFAWQLPTKLCSYVPGDDNWMEVYRNSADALTRDKGCFHKLEELDCKESLAGLAVVPNYPNTQRGFGLMQLTGSGGVYIQRYAAAKNLRRTRVQRRVEVPSKITCEEKKKLPKHHALVALTNYIMHGMVGTQSYVKAAEHHASKKMRHDHQGFHKTIAGAVQEVLKDVDVYVSSYELAFQALLKAVPETLQGKAAGMPSDVRGWVESLNKFGYLVPIRKFLRINDNPVPLPLPVALELHFKLQAATGGDFSYFDAALQAVEQALRDLKSRQEVEDEDLNSMEMERNRFCFLDLEEPSKFQKFVGAQASDEGSGHSFGAISVKLRFKPSAQEASNYQDPDEGPP